MSDSVQPHRQQPTRLPSPWDSPGKNTGVGCHFLLQCLKVKSESEAAQSCLTFRDPMDCSLPGSSIHGIFQARVVEWGAVTFSKEKGIGSEPTALPNFGAGANHQPPFGFFFFPSPFLLHLSSCFLSFPPATKSVGQIRPHASFRLVEYAFEFCLFLSQ